MNTTHIYFEYLFSLTKENILSYVETEWDIEIIAGWIWISFQEQSSNSQHVASSWFKWEAA